MYENVLPEEFFYDLAARASDRMMAELPSEEELAQKLSFSPEFKRKMELLLANPKSAKVHNRKVLRTLAIAAAITVLLFSAAMSVSAVRSAVFEFVTTLYEKYIVVMFVSDDPTLAAPEITLELREPSYVPEGFQRESTEETELLHSIVYLNGDGLILLFRQTLIDSTQYALDMEEEIHKVFFEMNGNTAMYQVKNDFIEMVWIDTQYSYHLSGQIDPEQALRVAQSVK